jgi:rubrerythrin
MIGTSQVPEISSLADLFAIAYQIEADAVERYNQLADQMETFNNPELVKVFRDLSRAEGIHAEEIRRQAGDIDVAAHARGLGPWPSGDSPEQADLAGAHYLMTPWHALQMALAGEQRAVAFFSRVVEAAKDPKIIEMAREFLEEEVAHVNLCHRLLQKYPAPQGEAWSEDHDPPVSQE